MEWRILALLVLSIFINYVDRGNLSIAAPLLTSELQLDPAQMGHLLSAFFWTYALMQLFGIAGWLADRFEVTLVFAAGFCVWSAATAFTGLVHTFAVLFVMRLLLGAGESIAYPCYSKILARYFPEERRGTANALLDAGSKMGPSLGTLLGGYVIAAFGWRPLFIILGAGCLLWLVPWMIWRPREHVTDTNTAHPMPGILEILSKKTAWGTFFGLFGANYFWFFLLTWLPSYLVTERHLSVTGMARVGSLAYFAIAASTVITGWLSDRWIRAGASVTKVRKTITVSGLAFSTVILPVAVVENNALALCLLLTSCVAFGVFASNHWAITQTLAGPVAAGRWTSLQNGVGNLAGIAAPYFTGKAVQAGSYPLAFAAAAIIVLLGAMSYAIAIPRVQQEDWSTARS